MEVDVHGAASWQIKVNHLLETKGGHPGHPPTQHPPARKTYFTKSAIIWAGAKTFKSHDYQSDISLST